MSEDQTPRVHHDETGTTAEGMVHGQVPGTQPPPAASTPIEHESGSFPTDPSRTDRDSADPSATNSGVTGDHGTDAPEPAVGAGAGSPQGRSGRAPRDLMDLVGSNWPFGPGTRQWLAGPWRDSWRDALPRAVRESEAGGQEIRVEETTQGDTHVVRAELPGVDPERDIDVSIEDGDLVITARREERSESRQGGVHRSEFRYGSFSRRLALPRGAGSSDIAASYRDGVLEVRLPVAATSSVRQRVPISRG